MVSEASVSQTQPGTLAEAAERYGRWLRAANKAPRTIELYRQTLRFFDAYLVAQGMPRQLEDVRREHVEAYIVELVETLSASTAVTRYEHLRTFFNWAVRSDELPVSPMRRMAKPQPQDNPPPVLRDGELAALFAACTGHEAERDQAIIAVFVDTGMRLNELARLDVGDVTLHPDGEAGGTVRVFGKGRRWRTVPIGALASAALAGYIGERTEGPLWRGQQQRFGARGISQMLDRRARQAGVGHLHPHQFRHTFAHRWLLAGHAEGDLIAVMGWRSRLMVDRYARSAAAERARAAHTRAAPLDGLLGPSWSRRAPRQLAMDVD